MRFFPSRFSRIAVVASLAIGIGTTTAPAGLVDPGMTIEWWVNGSYAGMYNDPGVFNQDTGWWNYTGNLLDLGTGVTVNFDFDADPDPLISGNLVVENKGLPVVNITLVVTLPIAPLLPAGSAMLGSAAIGLTTDIDGGSLSTFGGKPLWQGLIDGVAVGNDASLFFDPFALSNEGIGSSGTSGNFGSPVLVPGPAVLQSIGIEINFSLTQFDQASITSLFFVIPAPGVIALLAIGGLGTSRGSRRRRR